MKLPYLEETIKRNRQIVSFGGINHTDSYADGEMREAQNISFCSYPSLTVAQRGTEIFYEEGITDFFPFDDGYLIIKNNEARVYRIAKKEQIKVSEVGWIEQFTFSGHFGNEIGINEDIARGKYKISFSPEGDGIGHVKRTNYESNRLEIESGDIKFREDYDSAVKGDKIYTFAEKTDCLTVSNDITSSLTARVDETLFQEDADALVSKRYTINGQEVSVIGAMVRGALFLNFDKEISVKAGDKIYPYEYMPKSSSVTLRQLTETDITGKLDCDEPFYIYEDTFGKTETVDGTTVSTPILLSEGKKQIARVFNKICIFPDRICYDTRDLCFSYMEERVICSDFDFNATESTFSSSTVLSMFEAGDAVKFSLRGNVLSESEKKNCISAIIKSISEDKKTLYFNSNTFTSTFDERNAEQITEAVVTREIPKLEHICSGGGRLWGVLDGVIYASKYGDPCNFQFFEGGAADSYYLEAPGEGDFTACIPYSSYILFFREKGIIKLYGNNPEEFQAVNILAEGVMNGAERSLLNLGEVILYRGRNGIWGYTGDYPYLISKNLYISNYPGGAAGGEGDNYYISLTSGENGEKIWVYNLRLGLWLTINGKAERFINYDGGLCCLSGGRLEKINPKSSEETDNEFLVTFCPFFEGISAKKKYNRFYLTLEVFKGSHISIEVSVDKAPYKTIKNITNTRRRSVTFPIINNRCDTLSVRISGKGNIKIINFAYEYEEGSAIN